MNVVHKIARSEKKCGLEMKYQLNTFVSQIIIISLAAFTLSENNSTIKLISGSKDVGT